jgi:hypothetical protein
MSPGVMSVGLGTVPPDQTYLDVGQGNRVFDSLYDSPLPLRGHDCRAWQEAVTERAESAPAEIDPFLLTDELARHVTTFSTGDVSCPFGGEAGGDFGAPTRGVFEIAEGNLAALRTALSNRHKGLVVAIARPRPGSDEQAAIGIAGPGFDGDLTSDSTRTNGYVLSTDVAPTILGFFGVDVPSQMSGQPIRSEGSVDVGSIDTRVARMAVISSRRGPVIGLAIVVWLAAALLVAALSRGRLARPTVRVLGLSVVYMPVVLLLAAALEPSRGAEQALVFVLSPPLAALTAATLRGYRSLAVAAAIAVLAYAVDMIAGSPLTSLSLLGPNPGLGVRFYGIGNELEAMLGVLVVAGTGAGLAGFAPALPRRSAAVVFLVVGLVCAFVFAAGRFGADVGAAIVFPVGAVVAAAAIAGRGRRLGLLAVVAVPVVVLALLALIDLVTGANAHLTRSVLDAGGLNSLADVAQRRLQLSADSFARPVLLAFLPLVAIIAALAVTRRQRLREWLSGFPAMRAGLLGGLAASVIGTLANDSGALLLEIGTAYLLVFLGFAWSERGSGAVSEPLPSSRAER